MLRLLSVLILAILLVGCAGAPERELSHTSFSYATLPNGYNPLDPDNLARPVSREGAIPYYENLRGHALNILQLSGGGQYGAFGAGFINGWRKAGTLPEFDIVTGVSTGALLATHTFLGTPADDVVLEEMFTTIHASDIYKKRGMIGLIFGSNSVYDTSPLKGLIDKYITEELLQRVVAAHNEHRRIYVGTTNMDYQQTWVWNMGEIAIQGTPEALELYKKVLRASASPPIAFPPVEIAGHLFADGGVRQNIVVVGLAGKEKPKPPKYGPGTIYVVHNGQDSRPPHAIRNDAIHIAGPILETMLTNSMHSLLMRSYYAAHARGYNFRLVAIPDDLNVGHNALAFNQEQMQGTFNVGYKLGQTPDPWSRKPDVMEDIPDWALDASHRLP